MSHAPFLSETAAGLFCEAGGFHIDPWQPVDRALITHAHGDHARAGSAAYLCAEPSAALLRRRFGADVPIESAAYGTPLTLGRVRVSFHPAGHVLGSAQIRLESAEGVWVVGGDYKRAPDPTCAPFEPLRCDTFITESTFGLPIYRWDSTDEVIDDIRRWWSANRDEGRTSVLFCYTIGKAQRLLAELMRVTDRPVYVHGMMLEMIEAYREAQVAMLPVLPVIDRARGARPAAASFAGELVLAPLSARVTPWMRRLGDVSDACASGLMRVRGVRRQRAFDRGFVLSDHAQPRWIGGSGATRASASARCAMSSRSTSSSSDSKASRARRGIARASRCASRGCCAGGRTRGPKRPTRSIPCARCLRLRRIEVRRLRTQGSGLRELIADLFCLSVSLEP